MQDKSTAKLRQSIKLVEISVLGALRGLISLPLEHPFDTIKTWMQSENQGALTAFTEIHKKKGLKGFYSGFIINSLRTASKSAYRWPLNVFLMSKFRKMLTSYDYSRSLAGVATGVATAVIESAIICPFERIKIWLMTSHEYQQLRSFFRLKTLKALFDGFLPVMLKQTLSWVSFLGSQQYLKQLLYRHYKKTPEEYELSTMDLSFVSILVCLCNTACVMPADFIKTHYQKFSNQINGMSMLAFAKQIYKKGGVRQFYRGGMVKIIQYNINAFFTVQLFERVIRAYDNKQ